MLIRSRRFLLAVGAVLVLGAGGFLARSALVDDRAASGPDVSSLPVQPVAGETNLSSTRAFASGAPPGASVIATARSASIAVYSRSSGGHRRTLHRRIFNGQRIPLTLLVRGIRPRWLHVDLPARPNLSSGWVRRSDVRLATTRLSLVVRLGAHRLELRDGTRTLLRARVGVGRSVSPTPRGRYFITDIVRPPDPKGFYGPYALGLSAYSSVYTSFAGGNGQIGLHGTNQPAALGTDVSHGCIRLSNRVITRLAHALPLGTPVTIRS